MRFDLKEIVLLTGASVERWPHSAPVRLSHDFSTIAAGDLFFPMHSYMVTESLFDALSRVKAGGVVLYAGQKPPPDVRYPDLGVLTTRLPPAQYLHLAAESRRRTPGPVVGITGSSGKSSTKEFLVSVLSTRYKVHSTWRSRNLVPDCARVLLDMDGAPGEAAVIEMAFGGPGVVEQMANMAQPSAGIITKVTAEHLAEADGSWETVVQEKGKLGYSLPPEGVLAINGDDLGCSRLVRSDYRCRVMTFGVGNRSDMQYGDVKADESGTWVTLRFFGQELRCRLQTFGAFQAANAAAAALIGHVIGIPAPEIKLGLEQTPAPPRRFQVLRYTSGLTVINDTFSANVENTLRALEQARDLTGSRHLIAVLGAMTALGDQTDRYHKMVGEQLVGCGVGELFLIHSDGVDAIAEGATKAGLHPEQIHRIEAPDAITETLLPHLKPDTVIYFKAGMYLMLRPSVEQFLKALPAAGFKPLSPET